MGSWRLHRAPQIRILTHKYRHNCIHVLPHSRQSLISWFGVKFQLLILPTIQSLSSKTPCLSIMPVECLLCIQYYTQYIYSVLTQTHYTHMVHKVVRIVSVTDSQLTICFVKFWVSYVIVESEFKSSRIISEYREKMKIFFIILKWNTTSTHHTKYLLYMTKTSTGGVCVLALTEIVLIFIHRNNRSATQDIRQKKFQYY